MSWTTERLADAQAVFLDAAELPMEAQERFVNERCGSDLELCRLVEQLLSADRSAQTLLDRGLDAVLRGNDHLVGQRLGAFELRERIAEGGMGTVYRAERVGGDFEQQVAIKVLRFGGASARVRERFARERRTLARLRHPNVARLIDGGTTEEGVPFIVMELVDGVAIDRHCDQHALPLRDRLGLFATVCRAVHFAHQSLVVHLDLKPGNILVDSSGVPKLVDFGVATLLDNTLDSPMEGRAELTQGRPLTPLYSSPEQLRGDPVSTATDVFALGVVLYELLSGVHPFRDTATDHTQLARALGESEIVPPSGRVRRIGSLGDPKVGDAIARARRTSIGALVRGLRGDLDRIVLMAMHHDPARRYVSCQQFADDIESFLRGLPVLARRPTFCYRLTRLVARNRVAVLAVTLALVSLVTVLVSALQHEEISRQQRDVAEAARVHAEREREHAMVEAASSRIVAQMLGEIALSADSLTDPRARERLRDAFLRRANQTRLSHVADDHLRANVLDALGRACLEAELFDDSRTLIEEARAIRVAMFGEDSVEHALSLSALGRLQLQIGAVRDAAATLRRCYDLHRSHPLDVHTDVAQAANDLAAAERACGHRARARELHLEALGLRRARSGGDSALVAESLNNLATVETDPRLARAWLEEAASIRARVLGAKDPLTLQTRVNLATLMLRSAEPAETIRVLGELIEDFRSLGGGGRDGLGVSLRTIAYALALAGDMDQARTRANEALAVESASFQDGHPRVLAVLDVIARIDEMDGHLESAILVLRKILAAREASLANDHQEIGQVLSRLGALLSRTGQHDEAIERLERACRIFETRPDERALELADARFGLAESIARSGGTDHVEDLFRAAIATYQSDPRAASRLPTAQKALADFTGRSDPTQPSERRGGRNP